MGWTGVSGGEGLCPCILQGSSTLDPFWGVFVGGFLAGVTAHDRCAATRSCGNAVRSCAPTVQGTADHGCTSVQRGDEGFLHLVAFASSMPAFFLDVVGGGRISGLKPPAVGDGTYSL